MASRFPEDEPSWRRKSVPEMTSDERLASLKEWAEGKKYVQPGEGGTINANGIGGITSLAWGGPSSRRNQNGDKYAGQYDAPVGPPAYSEEPMKEQRRSQIGRWWQKHKEKRMDGSEKAPAYSQEQALN